MITEIDEKQDLARRALEVVKSRYLLCILVSQRIHQLERGALPTIEIDPQEVNPSTYFEIALKEIIEGNMDLEQIDGE